MILYFSAPPSCQNHTLTDLHFNYDMTTMLSITYLLGIPWHPFKSKGHDFQSTVSYVGFIWSLDSCSISLSCKKHTKYLAKVIMFLSNALAKVSRRECLSIHGTLQHITFIYCNGHAFLLPISSFLSKFPNEYT